MKTVDESAASDQQDLDSHLTDETLDKSDPRILARLTEAVSSESFDDWYREREFAQNIQEGQSYFNGPSSIQSPRRHSPSSLLQCKRKTAYKQLNAPEETEDPNGIFWFGSHFETDLVVPFLQEAVTGEDEYVTNSLWVDFTVETELGDIQLKGETDPVIVDADAEPLLLTEIKTKKTVDNLDSPNQHHKAQAHAYMKGLSEKYERNVDEALIIYGGRTTLNLTVFHIEFDPWFWSETILDWAQTHSAYRIKGDLPPAEPSFDWECNFCAFQERCGKGDSNHSDIGPKGLLPGFRDYPKQKVIEYLEAHDDARLTPALAQEYPDLAQKYDVRSWYCSKCGSSFGWDEIDIETNGESNPLCPICADEGSLTELRRSPLDNRSTESEETMLSHGEQ